MTREEKEKIVAECEHMSFDFELFGRPTKALCLDAVKNILNDISESEYISDDNSETESEIEPTTNGDLGIIHIEGLDEGIRCAMCTNSMANDRGCDGGCVVDKEMYKKVMDVIKNHIADMSEKVEPTTWSVLEVE